METAVENTRARKQIKRASHIKEKLFICSILAYPILQLIIFYFIVNANSLLLSFQTMDKDYNAAWAGFANFKRFFGELSSSGTVIAVSMLNSVLKYVISLLISFPMTLLFSYYVFKKMPAGAFFRITGMMPTILSAMLMGLMFQKFMHTIPTAMRGWGFPNFPKFLSDNQYVFGTTIFYGIWTGFASSIVIYSNGMGSIDKEIYESAQIDGANHFQELIRISLPLLMPTITTFMVTGVAGMFTNMGPLYEFYGMGAPQAAMTMGYYLTITTLKEGAIQYPYISSIGLILTLITFPLTMGVKKLCERLDPMFE